jgi:rubrerythrin
MDGGIQAWEGVTATGPPDRGMFLLAGVSGGGDILRIAGELEEGARLFYEAVRDILADEPSKTIFQSLADEEEGHRQHLLEACRKSFPGTACETPLAGKGAVVHIEGAFRLRDLTAWCREPGREPFAILELAMQIEADSLDFYLKLLAAPDYTYLRGILEPLAADERNHLERLGSLLESGL